MTSARACLRSVLSIAACTVAPAPLWPGNDVCTWLVAAPDQVWTNPANWTCGGGLGTSVYPDSDGSGTALRHHRACRAHRYQPAARYAGSDARSGCQRRTAASRHDDRHRRHHPRRHDRCQRCRHHAANGHRHRHPRRSNQPGAGDHLWRSRHLRRRRTRSVQRRTHHQRRLERNDVQPQRRGGGQLRPDWHRGGRDVRQPRYQYRWHHHLWRSLGGE